VAFVDSLYDPYSVVAGRAINNLGGNIAHDYMVFIILPRSHHARRKTKERGECCFSHDLFRAPIPQRRNCDLNYNTRKIRSGEMPLIEEQAILDQYSEHTYTSLLASSRTLPSPRLPVAT